MRRPLIAGNWKMHNTLAESTDLAYGVAAATAAIPGVGQVDVLVAPAFTALSAVRGVLAGTHVVLGAQNMHWAAQGPFTGEVSPTMVRELAGYVILGHSERRAHFFETDADVHKKIHAAFANDLVPILCVGESEAQREGGTTNAVVCGQVEAALWDVPDAEAARLVIAYEPVWAIGTGRACGAEDAARVCGEIRRVVAELSGPEAASQVRVLYGGSVNGANAGAYLDQADIDGALVGGASLKAAEFADIVRAAVGSVEG